MQKDPEEKYRLSTYITEKTAPNAMPQNNDVRKTS